MGAFLLPIIWSFCFGQKKIIWITIGFTLLSKFFEFLSNTYSYAGVYDTISALIEIGIGIYLGVNTNKYVLPYKLNDIEKYKKHQRIFSIFALIVSVLIFAYMFLWGKPQF